MPVENQSNDHWAIWIDVEGFSQRWIAQPLSPLRQLGVILDTIRRIGSEVYPEHGERLFVHQAGDGVVIVSDFDEPTLKRPAAIAQLLLQQVACNGGVAKAAISKGAFSDISGCYPRSLRDATDLYGHVEIGFGRMMTFTVMGTALIHAHNLHTRISGSLLLVEPDFADALPRDVLQAPTDQGAVVVDWVHSDFPLLGELYGSLGIRRPSPDELQNHFALYLDQHAASLPDDWRDNSRHFNHLP